MLKIVHVIPAFVPATAYGGPVIAMFELLRAQASLGVTTDVLTTDANGRQRLHRQRSNFGSTQVWYHRATPLNDYGVSPGLWRASWIRASDADVMHVHGTSLPSTTVASWAAALKRTPLVVSPHGSMMRIARAQRGIRKSAYRLLDAWPFASAAFHATSEAEAEDLRMRGHLDVFVIPNGVDAAFFAEASAPTIRRELGLGDEAPIVAWIGRFDPVKNLEPLIEATDGLGVHLVLAGDYHNRYGAHIRRLITNRARRDVHLIGYVEGLRKRALLQESAVYVHPSLMESYGLSIAEALAAGCPVVASTGTPWHDLDARGAGTCVLPVAPRIRIAIGETLARGPEARVAAARLAQEHDWRWRADAFVKQYRRLARCR